MFNPQLTDEQQQLVNTARKFTAETIIPVAHEYDEREEFPTPVFEAAFELGLMNVEIPEEYGGLGLGTLDGCLLAEELAYGCSAVSTSMMCNHLGALPLMVGGSEAQKQKYLNELCEEFSFISYACSEPDAGSDVAAMKSRLVPKEGGGYILNGQKRWITNAGQARYYTGFATIDPSLKHKGITAFVIDRAAKGVSVGRKEKKLGQRASETCDVLFEDVYIPEENIIGEPGRGFYVAMEVFDKSRLPDDRI